MANAINLDTYRGLVTNAEELYRVQPNETQKAVLEAAKSLLQEKTAEVDRQSVSRLLTPAEGLRSQSGLFSPIVQTKVFTLPGDRKITAQCFNIRATDADKKKAGEQMAAQKLRPGSIEGKQYYMSDNDWMSLQNAVGYRTLVGI